MKIFGSLVLFFICGVAMADSFKICLQDDVGELINLDVQPNGLLIGYSEIEIGGVSQVTGTAFGSFKRLEYPNVMLGGDINNDCASGLGLLPGKFNAIINVADLNGSATGVLFTCDVFPGVVIPLVTSVIPCDKKEVPASNWRKFFEEDEDD